MRKVFFSFDYDDVWRSNEVRNSNVVKNDYVERASYYDKADREKVKIQDEKNIKEWIDEQLEGTSVTCVLIGRNTSKSKWIIYEIKKSIEKGNGLLGIYIHQLKDKNRNISLKGELPSLLMNYNIYDWVDENGYNNIGSWIENAAQQAVCYY